MPPTPRSGWQQELVFSAAEMAEVPPKVQDLLRQTAAHFNKALQDVRFQVDEITGRRAGGCPIQDQVKMVVDAMRRDLKAQRENVADQLRAKEKQEELAAVQSNIMRSEITALRSDVEVLKTTLALSPELVDLRQRVEGLEDAPKSLQANAETAERHVKAFSGLQEEIRALRRATERHSMGSAVRLDPHEGTAPCGLVGTGALEEGNWGEGVRDRSPRGSAGQFSAAAPEHAEISVYLDRSKGGSLGLELSPLDEGLLVKDVLQGLVREWNESNPQAAMLPGDRIVAVNAEAGDARRLLEEVASSRVLRFTVLRGAAGIGTALAVRGSSSRGPSCPRRSPNGDVPVYSPSASARQPRDHPAHYPVG